MKVKKAKGNDENKPDLDSEKITSAGIESSKVLEVQDSNEFALIETNGLMNTEDFVSAMRIAGLDSNIEYIQPDYEMTVSSDPLLEQQWGLNSTETSGTEITVGADVTDAWAYSTGDGVIVAVLDSGIDISHSDLENSIYVNSQEIPNNGVDDDNNGYIDDIYGWDFFNADNSVNDVASYYDQWHGTHVAGIIAAEKDNDIGIAGVAPEAKILPVKIFEGGVAYTSQIIDAIAYAESMGAKIINCSWGSRYENQALEETIASSSALFVCATGNNLYNMDNYPVYPAAYSTTHDNVISVAAVDESGLLCRFSNYGENSVDIAAPGAGILSTWINEKYQSIDGTSMSAAYVSGAAALVFSKGTYDTASTVKERLIEAADTITGLEDKIIDGKKLDCAYAVSDATVANTNIIDIPDNEALPVIIPNTAPSEDDYELSGAENYVSYKASLNTARQGLQVVTLDGKIYAIGGQTEASSGYTNIVEVYDPETDTWSSAASMNYARSYFGAVVYDGKIYVMGGLYGTSSYRNNMEVYDPSTDAWTTLGATLPIAMYGFSATLIPDTSQIYVVGGRNDFAQNSVYEFDISTSTWTTKTSLSVGISNHVAFYYDGKIYIEGGRSSSISHAEYQYIISSGTTTGAVSARSYMLNAAGVLTNDRFIAIGGNSSNYSTQIMHSSLLVENTAGTSYYVSISHMLTARTGLGAALLDGKVYMIGGQNSNGVLSTVEMLDLGWQEKADLPEPITNYEAVELDGKIYVMGGAVIVDEEAEYSNAVYVYNSIDDTWATMTADMPVYAKDFSMTAAYGKIYLIGGQTAVSSTGEFSASNVIYEYDPQNDSWVTKNTISTARYNLSCTLLDGAIYIIGGQNSSGNSTNIVESYDPLTNTVSSKNTLPSTYCNHYSCVFSNELYVFGTQASNTLKYNETSDTWTAASPTGDFDGDLFVEINDFLYVLGDKDDDIICPSFYKYLPVENTFTFYNTFNFFGNMQYAVEINNKAYIFVGSESVTNGLVAYTPPATAWDRKASITAGCFGLGATTFDEDIYIAGGTSCTNPSTFLSTFQKYDESTNSWTTLANMANARSGLGLIETNGKLYALGGQDNLHHATNYVEEYNPATDTWTTEAQVIPRATADMAIASYNDKIYIFGGRDADDTVLNTVRIYDPSTSTWSTGTSMPTARYGCGAAVIDGLVYVTGGFTNYCTVTNVLEVYDPSTNTWDTTKADLPEALGYAGVVAADSLYVIDGYNYADEISKVYEYNPTLDEWYSWDGPNHVRYSFGAVITAQGLYVIGGKNSNGVISDVEFATVNSLSADYIHLGEDEINLSGNFCRSYTDMSYTSQGFNIEFSRTYNSSDIRFGAFGLGWSFGFQGSITSSGSEVTVRLPNGSGITFKKNSNGSFTAKDSRSTLEKTA